MGEGSHTRPYSIVILAAPNPISQVKYPWRSVQKSSDSTISMEPSELGWG